MPCGVILVTNPAGVVAPAGINAFSSTDPAVVGKFSEVVDPAT